MVDRLKDEQNKLNIWGSDCSMELPVIPLKFTCWVVVIEETENQRGP